VEDLPRLSVRTARKFPWLFWKLSSGGQRREKGPRTLAESKTRSSACRDL